MKLKRAVDSWWHALAGFLVLKHRDLGKMSQREWIVQVVTAKKGHWKVLPGDIFMFAPYFWSRFACGWHSAPGSCYIIACWRERFVTTFHRTGKFYFTGVVSWLALQDWGLSLLVKSWMKMCIRTTRKLEPWFKKGNKPAHCYKR